MLGKMWNYVINQRNAVVKAEINALQLSQHSQLNQVVDTMYETVTDLQTELQFFETTLNSLRTSLTNTTRPFYLEIENPTDEGMLSEALNSLKQELSRTTSILDSSNLESLWSDISSIKEKTRELEIQVEDQLAKSLESYQQYLRKIESEASDVIFKVQKSRYETS